MTMRDWFVFQARLDRVVDGDTIDLVCDLGFRARHKTRVRLEGVDTAEIYGTPVGSDEHERGMEHLEWVRDWFADHDDEDEEWPFVVDTQEDTGKYGRWPGTIEAKDGAVLNADLVDEWPEVADDG